MLQEGRTDAFLIATDATSASVLPAPPSSSVKAMDIEATLLEKLRTIEALHAGTTVDGEREAARRAAERIRQRLAELRGREQDDLLCYSLPDPWKRRLFVALCRNRCARTRSRPG
jgi:hypothetical protein